MTVVIQFRRPAPDYRPDPRNGEVWAVENFECRCDGDREIQTSRGFDVIHMSASGDSFGYLDNFPTMAAAEQAAFLEAKRRNAVFVPTTTGGQR